MQASLFVLQGFKDVLERYFAVWNLASCLPQIDNYVKILSIRTLEAPAESD